MRDPNNPCIFCKVRKEELQFENQLAFYDRSMIDVVAYLNYWKRNNYFFS